MHYTSKKENQKSKVRINSDCKEEYKKLLNAFSVGFAIEMSFSESQPSWYFGLLIDKYGIEWMVNFSGE